MTFLATHIHTFWSRFGPDKVKFLSFYDWYELFRNIFRARVFKSIGSRQGGIVWDTVGGSRIDIPPKKGQTIVNKMHYILEKVRHGYIVFFNLHVVPFDRYPWTADDF